MLGKRLRVKPENETISGGNGEGVPPVPIPNTEVKPFSADGTWLDTARESRSPPESNKTAAVMQRSFFVEFGVRKVECGVGNSEKGFLYI